MTWRLVSIRLAYDLRHRRWQLVVVGLLVAIATGTVLAAVADARRGASAVDRLSAATLPATVVVRANREIDTRPGWARLREDARDVAAVSTWNGYSGFAVDQAPGDPVQRYLPMDDVAMRSVERPVVLAGRLADPSRADEAVVTERFVSAWQRGVGDHVTVRLFSAAQVDDGTSAVHDLPVPRPAGPAVRVTIVGVVRSPFFSDAAGDTGQLIPSAGMYARYPHSVLGADLTQAQWGLVRLTKGDAGVAAFRQRLRALTGWQQADLDVRSDALAHARSADRFEAGCLLAFAAVALAVGLVLVGTAMVRFAGDAGPDLEVLRALGATGRQRTAAAAGALVVAGTTGVLAGLGLAVVASAWLPFGSAADHEPTPGVDVDGLVLATGTLAALLLVGGTALLAASRAKDRRALVPRRVQAAAAPAGAPGALVAALHGLPVPAGLGVQYALEADRSDGHLPGRGRSPGRGWGRSTLLASTVGVLGVVAAGTFAVAVRQAAHDPDAFGQPDQLEVGISHLGLVPIAPGVLIDVIRRSPRVSAALDLPIDVSQLPGGTVWTFGTDPAAPAPEQPSMLSGRPPLQPSELVLAPRTAARLHARIGSRLLWPGDRSRRTMTVTGIGLVPQTQVNEYDDGAWVTSRAFGQLYRGSVLDYARVRLRPGTDPAAVAGYYRHQVRDIPRSSSTFVFASPRPVRMAELGDLDALPLALGAFLTLLAVGAVGSSLSSSLRRHRRDIATLRALGMTPRQSRVVPIWQAAAVAGVGLIVGAPLGVVAGRAVWRLVAGVTPLVYRAPDATVVVAVTAGLTLLVAQLLAVLPGRRAARMSVARVLRTE